MTIQRQYSLPNCRLTLECLTEGTTSSLSDVRPLVSILMSAECRFEGSTEPIGGGREFFESFVKVVSQYAQEFLSGVPAPLRMHSAGVPVQIHNLGSSLHRLQVFTHSESGTAQPKPEFQIDLTTVQLFDLVEAVDQFLADSRTLPDFGPSVSPVPKRYAKAGEPVVKRALPAIVGISSVTLAALAFLTLPIPEVKREKDPAPQTTEEVAPNQPEGSGTPVPESSASPSNPTSVASVSPAPAPTNSAPPTPDNLEPTLTPVSPITDPTTLAQLQETLYQTVNDAWKNPVTQDLEFRVSITEDGSIVGYKPINPADPAAIAEQETIPLAQLLYRPTGEATVQEPLADFKVVFRKSNTLEVTPWGAGEPSP